MCPQCQPGEPRERGVTGTRQEKRESYLTRRGFSVNCIFSMATMPQFIPSEVVHDLDFPQREAAFFYGLFFRGQAAARHRSARSRPCQMAPRGRTRPAASRYFCAHGGLPPPRPGHLRYPCGFGWSPAARSVIFFFALILPVLPFRSKTVRQPNRIAGVLTDFGG